MEQWRLTIEQRDALKSLWENIPEATETFSASGLHHVLIGMLESFGFSPVDSYDAMQLAEELIALPPREYRSFMQSSEDEEEPDWQNPAENPYLLTGDELARTESRMRG